MLGCYTTLAPPQVDRYLQKYSDVASLPREEVNELTETFRAAVSRHLAITSLSTSTAGTAEEIEGLLATCRDYRLFCPEPSTSAGASGRSTTWSSWHGGSR